MGEMEQKKWLTNAREAVVIDSLNHRKSTVSSELTSARANMTALELKAFYQITTLIKMDDNNLFNYEIDILDFADAMGIARKFHAVDRLCDTLIGQCFRIERANGSWKKIAIFSFFELDTDTKKMRVAFNDQMRPYLLELKYFTKIQDISHIKAFGSKYAIRFYILFKDHANLGYREFELEKLAMIFELPKSYYNYTNFYKKVISPALKEINATSDIWVREPEVVGKSGKKITKIKFVFGEKEKSKWLKCRTCGTLKKKSVRIS